MRENNAMFDRVMAALDKESTVDAVHPVHYMLPEGLQVVDVEMAMFGKQAVMNHCLCTAAEYILRSAQKNGAEDVKKAKWWIDKWCELEEQDD